jgi:hypothetical protein
MPEAAKVNIVLVKQDALMREKGHYQWYTIHSIKTYLKESHQELAH